MELILRLIWIRVLMNILQYPLGQIVPGIFFDGVIGNGFYRRIGKKVLLDLDNMRLEAVQ